MAVLENGLWPLFWSTLVVCVTYYCARRLDMSCTVRVGHIEASGPDTQTVSELLAQARGFQMSVSAGLGEETSP